MFALAQVPAEPCSALPDLRSHFLRAECTRTAAGMVEKNPWWRNVAGPFPDWQGPLGCKEDGGGCHRASGLVGRMAVHRAVCNRDAAGARGCLRSPLEAALVSACCLCPPPPCCVSLCCCPDPAATSTQCVLQPSRPCASAAAQHQQPRARSVLLQPSRPWSRRATA